MMTFAESDRNATVWWRARNFGYLDRMLLDDGFSKCG